MMKTIPSKYHDILKIKKGEPIFFVVGNGDNRNYLTRCKPQGIIIGISKINEYIEYESLNSKNYRFNFYVPKKILKNFSCNSEIDFRELTNENLGFPLILFLKNFEDKPVF